MTTKIVSAAEEAAERSATPVYLDHAATTPIDPQVLAVMLPMFDVDFGNRSSKAHAHGTNAATAVERARAEVAALVGADADEIVFTSGATESNFLALTGLVGAGPSSRRRHVIAGAAEHKSVLATLELLERRGVEVTLVAPRADGRTTVDDVVAALRPETVLVSLLWVNNETGVINPIAELGEALRQHRPDVVLHTDATQAVGKVPVQVAEVVDALSMSAHKLNGPKGVGALYVRAGVRPRLDAPMRGGGQEGGLRGGTPNVPGIVGFGEAARLARSRADADRRAVSRLGERLVRGLRRAAPALHVHGEDVARVPGIWSISLRGISASTLLARVAPVVALSAGSACSGGSTDVSHVLRSMGVSDVDARSTVRFSLGRTTTEADVDAAVEAVAAAARELSPQAQPIVTRREPDEVGALRLEPIGAVGNDVTVPAYLRWGKVVSRIAVRPGLEGALDGLDGYSHVVVVSWLHHVETSKLRHVPQGLVQSVPEVGIFGCRCAYRPNPLGTSTVRLLAVEADGVVVEGLDLVDGTPILDLKPYTPQFDAPAGEVRVPAWVDSLTY